MKNNSGGTRFKVKAKDIEGFKRAKQHLTGVAHIYVESEKRLFLSIGCITGKTFRELEQMGMDVIVDNHYDLDDENIK